MKIILTGGTHNEENVQVADDMDYLHMPKKGHGGSGLLAEGIEVYEICRKTARGLIRE